MGRLIDCNAVYNAIQITTDNFGVAKKVVEDNMLTMLSKIETVEAIPKEKMIEMYDKIVKTSYDTAESHPKYKGIMLYEAQMIIDIMKEYLFKENEDATN